MTTYCSTTELVALTGTAENETTVLAYVIAAADREIDTYLDQYGLTGSDSIEACKNASLSLSKAGLIDKGLHEGKYNASEGGYSSSVDAIRAIESYRKAAFKMLDQYVQTQSTTKPVGRTFVRKVN
jgi:hypothetical protein